MNIRDFQMNDPQALELSRVFHKHFLNNVADFTALDSSLNAGYAATFLTAINATEAQPSDETTVDSLGQLSVLVDAATKNCISSVGDLRYYTEKAFGKNSAIYKSFALSRAWQMSKTTANFIIYMKVNHRLATNNQTALVAAGMTAAKILNIKTQADLLDTAEQNHELGERTRISTTATRVDTYNAMWVFVSRMNSAARVIYRTNREKLGLFRIPYKKRGKKVG